MNANRYRLVFNARIGAWVAAPESARAAGTTAGTRVRRRLRAALRSAAVVAVLLPALAAAQQPAGLQPHPGKAWRNAQIDLARTNANSMIISQSQEKAILHWSRMNLSKGERLHFEQQAANWAALNRIYDADPTRIAGAITAKGQVYLINQNGIVFADGAQVNVGGLVAATLDLSDDDFIDGILAPALESTPRPVFVPFAGASGGITIEPKAVLESAADGRIMVFAPTVTNQGTIKTPRGQAILGAGDKIYLMASQNADVRGLLIEVDASAGVDSTVSNLGTMLADRGNATLIGLTVNQGGTVSATTALNANGSIRLLARGGAVANGDRLSTSAQTVVASRTGTVTLAAGSRTEVQIALDDRDTTPRAAALDESGAPVSTSQVEVVGDRIVMEDNARIVAPSGEVRLTAVKDLRNYNEFTNELRNTTRNDSRIYLAKGAVIDVSGIDHTLGAERNTLEVELRGNELRDEPIQRNGFLRGKTITVDVRKGTELADISGALDNVAIDVRERSTIGGKVALKSEGDVIVSAGASIDASAGSLTYSAGVVNTTKLLDANGRIYDVGDAPDDLVYVAFADQFTETSEKFGISKTYRSRGERVGGYVEGQDGGSIEIAGYGVVLDGQLAARTAPGQFQRERGELPGGGKLLIGDESQLSQPARAVRTPSVVIAEHAPRPLGPDDPLDPDAPLWLSPVMLQRGGFRDVQVLSRERITVPEDTVLRLPAGGNLRLTAQTVRIDGDIAVPGGDVLVETRFFSDVPDRSLVLGSTASISTAGLWVNDSPVLEPKGATAVAVYSGGGITLSAVEDLLLHNGSSLDVSGGAWLTAGGELRPGDGGNLAILGHQGTRDQVPGSAEFQLGASIRGLAMGEGGKLTLAADAISIASRARPVAAGETLLLADVFNAYGFGEIEITAVRGDLRIDPGAEIYAGVKSLLPTATLPLTRSAATVAGVTQPGFLPAYQRDATDVTLEVSAALASDIDAAGTITVGRSARLRTDAGGSIELEAATRLTVEGTLEAPAGSISLRLTDPPSALQEPGFRANQTIWLSETARLLARGAFEQVPEATGYLRGEVLDGGDVELIAARGYVVAEAGSIVDVSGTSAVLDVGAPVPTQRRTVGSDAGSITLSAAEGLLLYGDLLGRPGAPGNAGGTLGAALTRTLAPGAPGGPREITLARAEDLAQTPPAAGIRPGGDIPVEYSGTAFIDAHALARDGFDALRLASADAIRLYAGRADDTVRLGRSLELDAPRIALIEGGRLTLDAPTLRLGNTTNVVFDGEIDEGDGADLVLRSQRTELVGHVAVQGAETVQIETRGDVRLRGTLPAESDADPTRLTGSLRLPGNLGITAAQVYPTTRTRFDILAQASGAEVRLRSSGGRRFPVLSADGDLRIDASGIVQGGVLLAPFGEITLRASSSLTLEAGSITSVSGAGLTVPYGTVENGTDWFYAALTDVEAPPDKRVVLDAPSVTVAAAQGGRPAAVLDLSGGGELYAYEFLAGPGGSTDVLANENAVGTYAVLPWLRSGGAGEDTFAPYDFELYAGADAGVGETVYLAGGAGLAAGRYVLLPARYALLPGAVLVERVEGFRDLPAGSVVSQGFAGSVVSGNRVYAGTGMSEPRSAGYRVRAGDTARQQAEYRDYAANRFFKEAALQAGTAVPQLPVDSGVLSIQASDALALRGAVRGTAGVSTDAFVGAGRGLGVEFASRRLALVAMPGQAPEDDYVELVASEVQALQAESVLLGGLLVERSADGRVLGVAADDLFVGGGASLSGPEILLVANSSVLVREGATLIGIGLAVVNDGIVLGQGGNGNGALVRVASGPQVQVRRANTTPPGPGDITIEAGAVLAAGVPGPGGLRAGTGSIALDATGNTSNAGVLDTTGSMRLGANRISLGETDGRGIDQGLVFSNDAIADQFGSLRELVLASYTEIDLYGTVELRGAALDSVRLETGTLRGLDNAGKTATIEARRLELGNPSRVAVAGTGEDGTLLLRGVEELALDAGDMRLAGFGAVTARAGERILVTGSGSLETTATLVLDAPLVTSLGGLARTIAADGNLEVTGAVPGADRSRPGGLGASLVLAGASVSQGGTIDLPSGNVTLRATAAGGDVHLLTNSVIDVSGAEVDFYGEKAYAPGGRVTLAALQGDVLIDGVPAGALATDRAALIDVSAAPAGGDAGEIVIEAAAGTLQVDGELRGRGSTAGRAGALRVDIGSLGTDAQESDANFGRLAAVAADGGLSEAFVLRLRTGDIVVGEATGVKARSVSLAADAGGIRVAGWIDASGEDGGSIELFAQNDLALAGGQLIARGLGDEGEGGRVLLSTLSGTITLDAPAGQVSIDVAGGGAARTASGEVHLRAPAAADGAGVAIGALDGKIGGARRVTIEGYRAYVDDELTTAEVATSGTYFVDARNFMNNAPAIEESLGIAGDPVYQVVPGVEIRSSGDLRLAADWSLHAWRYSSVTGQVETDAGRLAAGVDAEGNSLVAGVLTLRARGDLEFDASLSDGFAGALPTSRVNDAGESWSYRLVAGADVSAANPLAAASANLLAVLPHEASGSLVVASGTRPQGPGTAPAIVRSIRTGTGDIDIAAAGDLVLNSPQSVIYTAGVAAQRRSGSAGSTAVYAIDSGDVRIAVGGDAKGQRVDQMITGWLHREGNETQQASWWVDYRYFQQGIASLGGGDVTLSAGGTMEALSASAVATLPLHQTAVTAEQTLEVSAGGDILGGVYYVTNGSGRLLAEGSIGKQAGITAPLNPVLALGSGRFEAVGTRDVAIEAVVNPTVLLQSREQNAPQKSYFFTYRPDDSVRIASLNGDITLSNDITALTNAANFAQGSANSTTWTAPHISPLALAVYPASLRVEALQGGVTTTMAGVAQNTMTLFPSNTGDLVVLARNDIQSTLITHLSDAAPDRLPSVDQPLRSYRGQNAEFILNPNVSPLINHAAAPLHRGDSTRAVIATLAGDIAGGEYVLNKQSRFIADGDVREVSFRLQHANATDVSSILAGGEIVYTPNRNASNELINDLRQMSVSGPGLLEVRAGDDISLGNSIGIVSRGNLTNPALPPSGASLAVVVGAPDAPDYATLLDAVLAEYLVFDSARLRELTLSRLIAEQDPGLRPFYDAANPENSFKGAAFEAWFAPRQRAVIAALQSDPMPYRNDVFFTELKIAGRPPSDIGAGEAAIAALFPSANPYDGDLSLFFSQIRTLSGGDIDIFVPGGGINAGLASPPGDFTKEPAELGIVVQDTGRVRIFTDRDIVVNQSRIFTLRGGDLTLWSTHGNIDAGRGSKTAITGSRAVQITDVNGNVSFDFQGAAAGSGIRIILTVEGDVPGTVDLIAPRGEVNAGDAGIGSAGNLNIQALAVIGADNITAGGVSTGVPVAAGGVGASPAAVGGVAEATKSTEQVTRNIADAADAAQSMGSFVPSFITVEVIGLGEEESERN